MTDSTLGCKKCKVPRKLVCGDPGWFVVLECRGCGDGRYEVPTFDAKFDEQQRQIAHARDSRDKGRFDSRDSIAPQFGM